MKKRILSIGTLLAVLVSAPVLAQSPIQVGVKGGLTISSSSLTIDNSSIHYDKTSTKPGFEIGLQFRAKLPLIGLVLQPEIIYNRSAATFPPETTGNDEIEVRSNWIDVPIMLGWKFTIFRVMAGPSFRFPMNDILTVGSSQADVAPRMNSFVLGYQAGVGLDLGRFTADVRYCGNFTNITDDDVTQNPFPAQGTKAKDQRFSFTVGYMFLK